MGFAYEPKVTAAIKPTFENNLHHDRGQYGRPTVVAGMKPTVADCHLYAILSAGVEKFNYVIADEYPRLQRWYKNFSERPSASAGNGGPAFLHPKG